MDYEVNISVSQASRPQTWSVSQVPEPNCTREAPNLSSLHASRVVAGHVGRGEHRRLRGAARGRPGHVRIRARRRHRRHEHHRQVRLHPLVSVLCFRSSLFLRRVCVCACVCACTKTCMSAMCAGRPSHNETDHTKFRPWCSRRQLLRSAPTASCQDEMSSCHEPWSRTAGEQREWTAPGCAERPR